MRKISLQEDEIFFTVFFLPVESYIVFFTSNFNSEYWLSYWVRIDSIKAKNTAFLRLKIKYRKNFNLCNNPGNKVHNTDELIREFTYLFTWFTFGLTRK